MYMMMCQCVSVMVMCVYMCGCVYVCVGMSLTVLLTRWYSMVMNAGVCDVVDVSHSHCTVLYCTVLQMKN
jgi:hypothetical protein